MVGKCICMKRHLHYIALFKTRMQEKTYTLQGWTNKSYTYFLSCFWNIWNAALRTYQPCMVIYLSDKFLVLKQTTEIDCSLRGRLWDVELSRKSNWTWKQYLSHIWQINNNICIYILANNTSDCPWYNKRVKEVNKEHLHKAMSILTQKMRSWEKQKEAGKHLSTVKEISTSIGFTWLKYVFLKSLYHSDFWHYLNIIRPIKLYTPSTLPMFTITSTLTLMFILHPCFADFIC